MHQAAVGAERERAAGDRALRAVQVGAADQVVHLAAGQRRANLARGGRGVVAAEQGEARPAVFRERARDRRPVPVAALDANAAEREGDRRRHGGRRQRRACDRQLLPRMEALGSGVERRCEQRRETARGEAAAMEVVGQVLAVDRDPRQFRRMGTLARERAPRVAVDDREVVVGGDDRFGAGADAPEPAVAAKERGRGRRRDQVDGDAPIDQQAARRQVHQGVADLRRLGVKPDGAMPRRIDALDNAAALPARRHFDAPAQHAPGELHDAFAGEEPRVVGGDRLGDRLRHRTAGQRRERAARRAGRRAHRFSRGTRPIR